MAPREDPEKRALRILEAAGELILRWGYDKTTVDDVARAAGVAKGTLYLHWRTREELFIALLRHERLGMVTDVRQGIDADPNGVTPAGMVRQLGLALERRPLVRAFLLRDSDVIGKLFRQAGVRDSKVMSRAALVDYLDVLRSHGAVRTDLTAAAQANLVTAIITGFLVAEPILFDDDIGPAERSCDLMADAVRRALDPGRPLSKAKRRATEAATRDYVDRITDLTDSKLHASLVTGEGSR